MAVTLLKLDDGTTSLEFDREVWPAVRKAIVERYGDIEIKKRAAANVLRFGGQSFWNEILAWEPNLVADTPDGAIMLEDIATLLGRDGTWIPTPVYFGPHRPPPTRSFARLWIGAALVVAVIALAVA